MTESFEFEIKTEAEFRAALRTLIAAAEQNDIDINGTSITCQELTESAWELQITRLSQSKDG